MLPHECYRCRSSIDDETHARFRRMLLREGFGSAEVDAAFDDEYSEQHREHESEVRMVHAAGVYMDRGTLDIGVRRYSTAPTQNDLQLFVEEWTQVAMLGADSVAVTLPPGTKLVPTPRWRRRWYRLKNWLRSR